MAVTYLLRSDSERATRLAMSIVSAIYGAGYAAALCPEIKCIVAGAGTGGLLILSDSGQWIMLGSTFLVAPVAAGVLAYRSVDALTGLSDDYKLKNQLSNFSNQVKNQNFYIPVADLEIILKHLPKKGELRDVNQNLIMGSMLQ